MGQVVLESYTMSLPIYNPYYWLIHNKLLSKFRSFILGHLYFMNANPSFLGQNGYLLAMTTEYFS
jgi:hypothetical protein